MNANHLAGRRRATATETNQNAGGTGSHEVQCRGVGRSAANDYRNIEFVNELLQVQRLGLLRDVLSRNVSAANNKYVDAGLDHGLIKLDGSLWRKCTGDGYASGTNLCDAITNELCLNRLRVNLLHARNGFLGRNFFNLCELLARVFVAGP